MTQIPGIDAEKASIMYENDNTLYTAVLTSCIENTPSLLENLNKIAINLKNELKNDLKNEEILKEYAVNLHGLKGTFGTIGAEDLKKEAIELEFIVKSGDVSCVLSKNDAFIKRVYDLLNNISKYF